MGAVLSIVTGQNALEALAALANVPELTRSVYWEEELENFLVSADGQVIGTAALGNASARVSRFHKIAHSILQWPLLYLAKEFSQRDDCLRLGRRIVEDQSRLLTYDIVRQIFSLALIRNYIDMESSAGCNLVIGDGYGVFTTLIALFVPQQKIISVNLTKPLLLDLAYSSKVIPKSNIALVRNSDELLEAFSNEKIQIIGVRADDAKCLVEVPIGLAVNIVSMQEMDPPVVEEYFNLLRKNKSKKTAFYCCNKLYKRLADGAELKFNDYPWQPGDEVLHDSICPWSQWYYDKIPPFWHYRKGEERIIWHRLAYLEKDAM